MNFINRLTFVLCALAVCGGSSATAQSSTTNQDQPQWIWLANQQNHYDGARFENDFSLAQPVVAAEMLIGVESAGLDVRVNGQHVAELEPYAPLSFFDLTSWLQPGKNSISIAAKSFEGPSAFFLQLNFVDQQAGRSRLVSDSNWKVTVDSQAAVVTSYGYVDQRLLVPADRRVEVTSIDNYEQWKQALDGSQKGDVPAFITTPGFDVQRIRAATPDEDSWVSLTIDPQGRLIIAKESQGLLRMTLSDDGSNVVQTEQIEDSLLECRGLAFIDGDLYANANNSKGLFRLRRIDDDSFGPPELVLETTGGTGHGRNDLAVGPDQMLYSIHGDAVDLHPDAVDWTSPFRESRRGEKTREGHLLRIDPRTGKSELLTAGLRNPFGLDFHSTGDIFTYDADAEHDMGSPWYRPTRVSFLSAGGDYGWRGVTGSWPAYFPDHADNDPPSLDIGKGSPTAVKFYSGSNFPEHYRDALFILDWAYGRIIAVHCLPRGSGYLLSGETFLQGRPLNVTDLHFAADGTMYFVTGGRKTRSALYRVRYSGKASDSDPTISQQALARTRYADQRRSLRRELEQGILSDAVDSAMDQAWRHLADPDPWIAAAARHVLEQRPLSSWQDRALRESNESVKIQALLSLARSGQADLAESILDGLNQCVLESASHSDRLAALQSYRLVLSPELIESNGPSVHAMQQKLSAWYPERSYAVNQLLSELLVELKDPEVVAKTIPLLRRAQQQDHQLFYLYVLRSIRQGWTLADRTAYFSALNETGHFLAGAGMPEFLKKIRIEAIETLSETEQAQLASLLQPNSQPTESISAEPRSFVKKWTVKEVLDLQDLARQPDLERGRRMFAAASCNRCHRIAGRGTPVGPDLTSASRRFGRSDLLTAIIEPSQVIAENYQSVQILTDDGRTFTGQTVVGGDYRSPKLKLAMDANDPTQYVEIDKSSIVQRRQSPVSWMPTGLLDTLSHDEIMDLLAYIESGGSITAR